MKSTGGKRNSPAEQATQRKLFPCHLCDFSSESQSVWDKHLKEQHRNVFTCPFCDNTFRELNIVKKHIFEAHKENGTRVNKSTKNTPCTFFSQVNGCKKKENCDFSHDLTNNDNKNNKVPKHCWNGPMCRWKPRCRYVHPEDGETIPPREERLGFFSRPPPVYTAGTGRREVPDIRNLTEFPGVGNPRHMMEILV